MTHFKRDYNAQEARILAIEKEQKTREHASKKGTDQEESNIPLFNETMKNKKGLIEIKMSDVSNAIIDTLNQDLCPLLICPKFKETKEDVNPVDVWLSYQETEIIDATSLLNQLSIKKTKTKPQLLEIMRSKLVNAIKNGKYMLIRFGQGCVTLQKDWNGGPDVFPIPEIFKPSKIRDPEVFLKLVREEDKCVPGSSMKAFIPMPEQFKMVVTSELEPHNWQQYLKKSLPLEFFRVFFVVREKPKVSNQVQVDGSKPKEASEKSESQLKFERAKEIQGLTPKDMHKEWATMLQNATRDNEESNPKKRAKGMWPVSEMVRIVKLLDKDCLWDRFNKPTQSEAREKIFALGQQFMERWNVPEDSETTIYHKLANLKL